MAAAAAAAKITPIAISTSSTNPTTSPTVSPKNPSSSFSAAEREKEAGEENMERSAFKANQQQDCIMPIKPTPVNATSRSSPSRN